MTTDRRVRLEDERPTTKITLRAPANIDWEDAVRRYNEDAEKNGLPKILAVEKQDG